MACGMAWLGDVNAAPEVAGMKGWETCMAFDSH